MVQHTVAVFNDDKSQAVVE